MARKFIENEVFIMAKKDVCVFCGKEMNGGFFSSESQLLDVGHSKLLTCCEDCYSKYQHMPKEFNKRFAAKLTNAKRKSGKKMTAREVAKAYEAYVAESADYQLDAEPGMMVAGCFIISEEGYFSVKEYSNALEHSDVNARQMVRTAQKASKGQQIWFTKDDITKIEYFQNGMGSFAGMFHKVFSFSIRLNDETVITYKPAMTRASVLGKGVMFGYKGSARKALEKDLRTFRALIGSDAPIRCVSK